MADNSDVRPIQEPLAELERAIIDEYLRGAGYDPATVRQRTDADAHRVLVLASSYAAGKLTEVESKLHYLRTLRGHE